FKVRGGVGILYPVSCLRVGAGGGDWIPGRLGTAARSPGGSARHSRKSIQQFCDHMVEPSATQARRGALSGQVSRIYFRADAAFAMPEVYEFLEAKRIKYAIRLPANQVLQGRIGYLLKRPVGRPMIRLTYSLPTTALGTIAVQRRFQQLDFFAQHR